MLFSEMKKGQLLGAKFDDEEGVLEQFRGQRIPYRVLSVRPTPEGLPADSYNTLHVENTRTNEKLTFVGTDGNPEWSCWELVEPAPEGV